MQADKLASQRIGPIDQTSELIVATRGGTGFVDVFTAPSAGDFNGAASGITARNVKEPTTRANPNARSPFFPRAHSPGFFRVGQPFDSPAPSDAAPASLSSKGVALLMEAQERNRPYTTLANSGIASQIPAQGSAMVPSTGSRPAAISPNASPPKNVNSALPAPLHNQHPSALTTGSIDRGPATIPSPVAPGTLPSTTVARVRFAPQAALRGLMVSAPVPSDAIPRNTGRRRPSVMMIRDFETAFGTNLSSSLRHGAL